MRALTLQLLTAPVHALFFKTRSRAQKPPCKDLWLKWPKPSHLSQRPLTLRFLTGLVHALKKVKSLGNKAF
ncbi:hypothetical protein F9B82_02650 [Lacticaseibacillus casei]|nr:hypothetical protein F9B82_02650 [Lacticaseibacillus casei]